MQVFKYKVTVEYFRKRYPFILLFDKTAGVPLKHESLLLILEAFCIILYAYYIFCTVLNSVPHPQVAPQVLSDHTCQLMETLCKTVPTDVTSVAYKLNADLRALSLVYSVELPVVPPPDLLGTVTKLLEKIIQENGRLSDFNEN